MPGHLGPRLSDALAYPPNHYSGIVVLRHPHPTMRRILNLVHQLAVALQEHDPEGMLWVVEPGRLRVYEPS